MTVQKFDPSSTAVVTTTYYPNWYKGKLRSLKNTDKIRGDLALELIIKASKMGCRVVVSDWQSPKTFRKELKNLEGLIIVKRRSVKRSPSKRQVIGKATKLPGVKVIILTEAEKVSLITDCLPDIVEPVLNGACDIVVPKRDEELFRQTYPAYQYESEVEGNRTYNEELISHKLLDKSDNSLDMFFGPRVFASRKEVISLFMKSYQFNISNTSFPKWYFDTEELSNANYFPIVLALKKGLKVQSVDVPFRYPALQKQNEDLLSRESFLEKRKMQRIGLIIELLHFVSFLEKSKGTGLNRFRSV